MNKLSISNIGWTVEQDNAVYELMKSNGYTGLEIAPTRIFSNSPYDQLQKARKWADELRNKYGFSISSMQSIWYGRSELIFGNEDERAFLLEYTKKAIRFAEAIECKNLVFGCPKNRAIPNDKDYRSTAISFFRTIGDYAAEHNTVIGMEANPTIYNTNFINTTNSAIELIETVNSKGFKLNLDLGTMIYNEEDFSSLSTKAMLINHVHISEPQLIPIKSRAIHKKLISYLKNSEYSRYISIETGKQDCIDSLDKMMKYVKSLCD